MWRMWSGLGVVTVILGENLRWKSHPYCQGGTSVGRNCRWGSGNFYARMHPERSSGDKCLSLLWRLQWIFQFYVLSLSFLGGNRQKFKTCHQKSTAIVTLQKRLGVHKILVRKIWLNPPPPKGPKMRKNCTNQYKPLKLTLFAGGGGTRFYGQNDFMDIWAFLNSQNRENMTPKIHSKLRSEN